MSEAAVPPVTLAKGPTGAVRQYRFAVGILLVFLALGYLIFTSIKDTTVYYLTVSELQARTDTLQGERVRIAGNVAEGTVERDVATSSVRFVVYDESGQLPVVHKGMVPDIFAEHVEVVVEGVYTGDEFHSTTLLAKCPSRFEGQLNTS